MFGLRRFVLSSAILAYFPLLVSSEASPNIWESPYDIFGPEIGGANENNVQLTTELNECRDELKYIREKNQCRGPRFIKQACTSDHYLKRFVNMFLASANFKNRKLAEGHEMKVNSDMYFNSRTLHILQSFASDDHNGYSWHELDGAIVSIFEGDPTFKAIFSEQQLDEISGTPWSSYDNAQSSTTFLFGIVGTVAISIIWVYLIGGSMISSMFVGAVIISSVSFAWFYYAEVEHKKLEFLHDLSREDDSIPSKCLKPAGYFEWMFGDSCQKLLHAKNLNVHVAINLETVFKKTAMALFSWIPALAAVFSKALDEYYGSGALGSIISFISKPLAAGSLWILMLLLTLAFLILKTSFRWKTWLWEIEVGKGSNRHSNEPSPPSAQPPQGIWFSNPGPNLPGLGAITGNYRRTAKPKKFNTSLPSGYLSNSLKKVREDRSFRKIRDAFSRSISSDQTSSAS